MSNRGSERLRRPLESVPSGASDEDPSAWIGAQIRALRKGKGVTLEALGADTGLSLGYLSQVERGRSKLSIANLMRIGRALDVHINWFFPPSPDAPPEERGTIVRAENRRSIRFPGLTEELMSPSLAGPLELVMSVLEPGGDSGEPYTHKGHEAGVVIAGTLDLWIGERQYQLREGDSFSFPSSTPHRCRNPGRTTTRVVWVITPPSY